MPLSGLSFEKDAEDLTKKVLDFFERVRYSYLSARNNPSEYSDKWAESVEHIREKYDKLDNFSSEMKNYVDEKTVFDNDAKNPTSLEAKRLFEAVKDMRFKSDKVTDPFSKEFGEDEVVDTLLANKSLLIAFMHYALRSHSNALPKKVWVSQKLKPDNITGGVMGLDLDENDIALYITEHYGAEDKDTTRIESKVKGAMKTLKDMYLDNYEESKFDNLVEVDIKKSKDEKAAIDFLYRRNMMGCEYNYTRKAM